MSNNKLTLNIIAAACNNMGIGNKGQLPWRLKKEMNFFKEKTSATDNPEKQNAVIMGRKTWFSIPEKFRPLPGRLNIVLTTTHPDLKGADYVADSFEKAVEWLTSSAIKEKLDKIFVIGGETVYKIAMDSDYSHRIYLTRIQTHFDCDSFFPAIDDSKYMLAEEQDVPLGIQEENGVTYKHEVYVNKDS
ncbi:dihydrofolate reductase-like [Stegodyphus dumicola]|uniref:dihydrofolate reductase-like n=1 Tax=Stegodyphus dumicola TaxID=202533 RepID=UPI0015B1FBC7|nr:dihydrofolate reductase-like [Stegodyphus dumicola]